MTTKFLVITEVPDPIGPDRAGNIAASMDMIYRRVDGAGVMEQYQPLDIATRLLGLGQTVFSLGEILIVDSDGREVVGKGRKPSKWGVKYAEFDSLELAIECAQEVQS